MKKVVCSNKECECYDEDVEYYCLNAMAFGIKDKPCAQLKEIEIAEEW